MDTAMVITLFMFLPGLVAISIACLRDVYCSKKQSDIDAVKVERVRPGAAFLCQLLMACVSQMFYKVLHGNFIQMVYVSIVGRVW